MNGAFRLGAVAAAGARGAAPGPGPAPGGFPELLDTTLYDGSGSRAATHSVTMPATVAAGDGLLMLVHNTENRNLVTPSGWALIGSAVAINTGRLNWIWKAAAGTEGGTTQSVGFSGSNRISARTFRFAAGTFHAAGPVEVNAAFDTAGLEADPPSLSPTWGAASTLWLAVAARTLAGAAHTINDWPFPDGQVAYASAISGANGMTHRSCLIESAVATLDPPAYNLTNQYDWAAFTVAIRPAA